MLRLHNSLTKRTEDFVPRDPGKVAMYVCGPTVYDVTHLGHMRAAIVFDILRRYLEAQDLAVRHVQNITDVEDKIIARAQAEGVSTEAITGRYIADYRDASRQLAILPPHVEPRASQHIAEMIEMIQRLIDRGFAYYAEGDVYFDVTKMDGYGKLSGRVLEDLKAGARVEPGEFKRHPADFALWKGAKPGEPSWESPWGRGRPGWHIECSAMSLKYLDMGFDIHGGGDDLIFPHHENEIAQSEAYTGRAPFARFWIHNAMVMVRGEKMSKSQHNYIAVSDALAQYSPQVVRYALGAVHYRKPLEVTPERLDDAARAVDRLRAALASADLVVQRAGGLSEDGAPSQELSRSTDAARRGFATAMDDDLNTSGALAAIFQLASDMNRLTDQVLKGALEAVQAEPGLSRARAALVEMTGILGLQFGAGAADEDVVRRVRDLAAALRTQAPQLFGEEPQDGLDGIVAYLLAGRERARAARDFSTADRIRGELSAAGILVEDLPTGPRWRVATADGLRTGAD
ncbi:MAG TPA: cysteine--tRNA ligase [bacterium]|jgi:cysteinyl-tRNA synthetase